MRENEEMQDSGTEWFGMIPKNWIIERIKDIVAIKITDGPHETPTFVESGIPFISAEAIKHNKIDFEKKRGYITQELHEIYSKKCKPQKFDVFIIKSGATTGNVAYVDTDIEFNIWSPLAVIRCKPLLASYKYIYYQLLSDVFKKQVEISWSFGTQENIGMGVLGRIYVSLPPLAEQQSIVQYLDQRCKKLDAIIAIKQRQIKTLDALRQSIIYQAVTKGLENSVPLVDSGVEWLGKTPQGWKISKLRYEISIKNGDFVSNRLDDEYEYPVVGGNGLMGRTNDFNVNGDIIVIGRVGAYCGNVHYINEKSWVSDNALIVDTSNNKRFFTYLLNAFNLNSIANKTAQPVVTATNIKAIYVPIPPHSEQQSIVDHLDHEIKRLNELKANLNQQITTLEAYKKSLIYECVTGKKRIRNDVLETELALA